MNEKETGYGCSVAILIIALVPIALLLLSPLVIFAAEYFHFEIDIRGAIFCFALGLLFGLLIQWVYYNLRDRNRQIRGFEIKSEGSDQANVK